MPKLTWIADKKTANSEWAIADMACYDGNAKIGDVCLLPSRSQDDAYRWSWSMHFGNRALCGFFGDGIAKTRLQAKKQVAASYRRLINGVDGAREHILATAHSETPVNDSAR